MTAETVIYPARLVRTMDPARPVADAVAVVGDRIRAVGSLGELRAYGPHRVDDRYRGSVLVPGFVEAHSHASVAAMWRATYVGYFPRSRPDGGVAAGCTSLAEVIRELSTADAALADPHQPLLAWGWIRCTSPTTDSRHHTSTGSPPPVRSW